MPAIDPSTGRLLVSPGFTLLIPATSNKRLFSGACDFYGYRLNSQVAAGSGIKFYDGIDNTGAPIMIDSAPTVSDVFKRVHGATVQRPYRCRFGLYVELLGTSQSIDAMVGD